MTDLPQALKNEIAKQVKKFIMENLYNHKKDNEGLVSLQNTLLQDYLQMNEDWRGKMKSYKSTRLSTDLLSDLNRAGIKIN